LPARDDDKIADLIARLQLRFHFVGDALDVNREVRIGAVRAHACR